MGNVEQILLLAYTAQEQGIMSKNEFIKEFLENSDNLIDEEMLKLKSIMNERN